MTTPYQPSTYLAENTADQFWAGIPGSPDILIVNLDQDDNITIGPKGIQPNASNGYTIAPLDAISLPGTSAWSVVTDSLDAPLTFQVIPGGGNWSASALAIAGQIASSGLALAIAEEIAIQGIGLIGNPQALYGGSQSRTGAGLVGVTLSQGSYPTSTSDFDSYTIWDAILQRPMNTVSRRYYQEGITPATAATDNQSLGTWASNGFKVCVTYKPFRDGTNNYSGAIPGQGGLTYAQHLTNLKAAVAYAAAAGTAGIAFCLWHEMNGNGEQGPFGSAGPYGKVTAAQAEANYAAYVNFYGPAFKALTNAGLSADQTLAFVPAAYSPSNMVAFFPTPNVYHTEIDVDYYCYDAVSKPNTVPQGVNALEALADSLGFNFGMWEWGPQNGSKSPTTAQMNSWIATEVLGRWLARLNAGKTNADLIWFGDPGKMGGTAGVITSSTPQSIIQSVQSVFDGLSNTPASVISIAGGAAATLTPLNPSQGGGYAEANGLSYDITLNLVAGVSSTNPFVTVRMHWFNVDASGAQSVSTQHWSLPMGANGTAGTVITGVGPQHGQFLAIVIQNNDTVTCDVSVQLNSTSRTQPRHNWIWDASSSVSVPGFTLASGASYANSLGSVSSQSIPAASGGNPGTKTWLFGLFAGPVYFRFGPGVNTGVLQVIANPMPSGVFGSNALLNETPMGEFETELLFPRGPVTVTVNNSDSSAHNASIGIIADN